MPLAAVVNGATEVQPADLVQMVSERKHMQYFA
jgi:hypothetical protein